MSRRKSKKGYVNYQEKATDFSVNDLAVPFFGSNNQIGRVVGVFPAIGMVDLELPQGVKRYPVEDIQLVDSDDSWINPPRGNSVPGGPGQVSVPGGPYPYPEKHKNDDYQVEIEEKAKAFDKVVEKAEEDKSLGKKGSQKKALYWFAPDRKYRATKTESVGSYSCPRCKDVFMKKCIYRRKDKKSERLLGCPQCLFLIEITDILG